MRPLSVLPPSGPPELDVVVVFVVTFDVDTDDALTCSVHHAVE